MNEIKNLPHSIHERLKYRAQKSGKPFDWYLRLYAMERFLFRLSKTRYCNNFVLKGGLMFMGWQIPLRRFTRDIDFRAFTSNEREHVTQIIKEICLQEVEPDGIEFDVESISFAIISEEAEYSGVRIRFSGHLGERTMIPMQIDIGFSDEITPEPLQLSFPSLLEMSAPNLLGYPKETVVAEKLECIIYRGKINSRYKDLYDLWMISKNFDFDGKILQEAIHKTFKNRKTEIPLETPPGLSDEYAVDKQKEWTNFLKGFTPDIPEIEDFRILISELRGFLLPLLHKLIENKEFGYCWDSEKRHWKPVN